MLRISTTTLEKFRRYIHDVSLLDTEESLIESLMGAFTGNEKTMVGTAFHSLIEGKYTRWNDYYIADNIMFTQEQASGALNFKEQHPAMVHEVTINKVYETAYFPIQVTGRIDGIEGVQVHDHKTKFRNIDWHEYLDSIQWRIYLDQLNADIFWYNVFEVKGFEALIGSQSFTLPEVEFISHEPLKCTRYVAMEDDITALLNSFLEYIHDRKFLHLLKPASESYNFLIDNF